ncbi:hypothetical protein G5I_03437 [Acromyrmex echinatior]|uniref:Uncharacterized protein n=1 Tax=Acromyrmex echinatior TaxID=103372 RepID=F4WCZ9_ACREC|nr:hypothetical protein G5I_03437 [Acromyrmex echinatior]
MPRKLSSYKSCKYSKLRCLFFLQLWDDPGGVSAWKGARGTSDPVVASARVPPQLRQSPSPPPPTSPLPPPGSGGGPRPPRL